MGVILIKDGEDEWKKHATVTMNYNWGWKKRGIKFEKKNPNK